MNIYKNDAFALFSVTNDGLQKLIDSLDKYSREYNLYINFPQTIIVILRNRDQCKMAETMYL